MSAELVDVTVDQLQGSIVSQLGGGDSRVRPFLSAGAGAAIFGATDLTGGLVFRFRRGVARPRGGISSSRAAEALRRTPS